MTQQQANAVVAFVDWPNIDKGLRRCFKGLGEPEHLARLAIPAIKTIAGGVGHLESANVYADWRTSYSRIVPLLESDHRFDPVLVPRKASGDDRCDATIVADIVDFTYERDALPKPVILLCAGDADYAVAVRRALRRGFEVHIASDTSSLSPELSNLSTSVYPLERYFSDEAQLLRLSLTPELGPEEYPDLGDVRKWAGLVRFLDRMSRTLEYVTLSYFTRQLSTFRPKYGETVPESYDSVEEAVKLGIVKHGVPVPNPTRSGHFVQTIVLSNENILVRCILENIKVPGEISPDTLPPN